MKLQFVSDVACPWCAIGLYSLEIALKRIGDESAVDLELEPFELNPDMPPEGEDVLEYVRASTARRPSNLRPATR